MMPALSPAILRPPGPVMALPFITRLTGSRGGALEDEAPVEELVLDLSLPRMEEGDEPRPAATARLAWRPSAGGAEAASASWHFVTPPPPVGEGDLRWYLEKYVLWPSGPFRRRARSVEEGLVRWGRALHDALPAAAAPVVRAWMRAGSRARRQFTVRVGAEAQPGASAGEWVARRVAAAGLLALPWELLHDGRKFLFQGRRPVRVRRSLAGVQGGGGAVPGLPIRILLVTARPEDESCPYFDHRVSALPLVQAMEALPGLVRIHVLDPPTFPALAGELHRAREAGEPYHVLHFDGHGTYDPDAGMGALCFEHPDDDVLVEGRAHAAVYTDEMVRLLRECPVPLVFLEACRTAEGVQAAGSVASALLEAGVPAVVAMSHSVLVETSRRFVEAFYAGLSGGGRVGDAMLSAQRRLKEDPSRGSVLGAGELRLQDWFVPVLFQGGDDPRLFAATARDDARESASGPPGTRLHGFPPEPSTGFVGRSRELLALQRLLRQERHAVVVGQGGEGKTELAAELARWLVRSQQIDRAVFVSVETHGHAAAVLDAIGNALLPTYSVATFADLDAAARPVEDALAEAFTLLVVDNLESVLPPLDTSGEEPGAIRAARRELDEILALCTRLAAAGETRVVFTSRELLPSPFEAVVNRRELGRLAMDDAVLLVERALNAETGTSGGKVEDAAREEIEELVEAVHGHARTLALLAPSLRAHGAAHTRASLAELMAEMDRAFPGNRERSLFASVELSLRRLSPENRERVRVLAPFQGAVDPVALRLMTEWDASDVESLAADLAGVALATRDSNGQLTLDPALCPYLRGVSDSAELDVLTARWTGAMRRYLRRLVERVDREPAVSALIPRQQSNLLLLLAHLQRDGDPEPVADVATTLVRLFIPLGMLRAAARVGSVRDTAEAALGETWSHIRFSARQCRIDEYLEGGRIREAIELARDQLARAREAGETAYPEARLDLAIACYLLGRVLRYDLALSEALQLFDEAERRFEAIADSTGSPVVRGTANQVRLERGDALRQLKRMDEAAAAYDEYARRARDLGEQRSVAAALASLGAVRMHQRRYEDALDSLHLAREAFEDLSEPGNVATTWEQIGLVYQHTGALEAAEDAYREALRTRVGVADERGRAAVTAKLAVVFCQMKRPADAVPLLRKAVELYERVGDLRAEGRMRGNLALALLDLDRYHEARAEILVSLERGAGGGHAYEPWKVWNALSRVQTALGDLPGAREANRNAVASFLQFRRDGGENTTIAGRAAALVHDALAAGGPARAAELSAKLAADPENAVVEPFSRALNAIASGSRDPALADDPELHYALAAEILYLIETLGAAD